MGTILAVLLLVGMSSAASGSVFLKNGTEIAGERAYQTILEDPNTPAEPFSIQFFYNTHCGACHYALAFLDEYRSTHPHLVIEYHDLYNNTENRDLFEAYKKEYNRTYASVPIIFMGNAVLEGSDAIKDNFEPLVNGYAAINQNGSVQTNDTQFGRIGEFGAGIIEWIVRLFVSPETPRSS